jgi:hypothetical protein
MGSFIFTSVRGGITVELACITQNVTRAFAEQLAAALFQSTMRAGFPRKPNQNIILGNVH